MEACESGSLQGEMIIKEWNNKSIIDKNGDNKIQYMLLQGDENNLEIQYKTGCVTRTINQKGLQSSEIALGDIMALQGRGYNMEDHNKYIPVVGIDGIDEVKKLIKSGVMTGTVIQDDEGMARALYSIGMNLAEGKEPLNGIEYKFDSTGVSIRIPYKSYITKNSPNL